MRGISRLLSLSFLTFLIFFLGGAITGFSQEKERSREYIPEDIIYCYFPSPGPQRYQIAITDLVRLDEKPGFDEAGLSKRLANNLKLTGDFELLDQRAFLEKNPSAGLDGKSEPDYQAWRMIGTDFLIKGSISETAPTLILDLYLFDVGQKRQMLAKRYKGKPTEARKMINQFTNAVLEAITGVPGVFGSEIIFVAGEQSKRSIMMTEFGGDDVVEIAGRQGGPSTQPTLGPAGRRAWIHRNGNKWQLVLDGQVISSGPSHLSPAFKPDGTVVAAAYTETEPRRTAIYTFSGQNEKTLLTAFGDISVSPTFSPDGSRMAFVSDQGGSAAVYVSSAEGGPATRLTSKDKATDPAWSPTGEYIVFVSRETDICLIRPDGSGFRQLTGGQGRNYRPSFSPDGRLIVFASDRNKRMQLFVMNANGGRAHVLMPDYPESQDLPYWSPTRSAGN